MKATRSITQYRFLLYGLLLALVTSLLLFGRPVAGQSTIAQGWNVILVIDQSSSMFEESDPCQIVPGPDDIARPEGLPLRQWAAIQFIDYLGVDQSGRDRVGIIYFGTEHQKQYDLFPAIDQVGTDGAKELLKTNNCPPDFEWTNTNLALESAYNELVGQSDDRQKVVILLTDGRPQLPGWEEGTSDKQPYYVRHFELIEQYKQADIKLFIIALGQNAQLEDPTLTELGVLPVDARKYRDLWNHAAAETDGEYYKVETNDELWTTYHAIATKLARVFPSEVISGNKEEGTLNENFEVPESARMIITVERSSTTQSTLLDPSGNPQEATRSDQYYQIYNFTTPQPGRWTLRFEGAPTRYTVLIDFKVADLNLEVNDLPQVHPLSKPLTLRLQITDDDGAPQEEVLAGVAATAPDGSQKLVSLVAVPGSPGVYEGQWVDTDKEGDYILLFQATQGDKKSELQERITLNPLPYLELIGPKEGEFIQEAVVHFALIEGTERVATVPADTTVEVSLLDSNGEKLDTLSLPEMSLETDTTYRAKFEDIAEGDYALKVVLNAPNEGMTDEVTANFHLSPVPPADPICLQDSFGTVEAKVAGEFQLSTTIDTSLLERPPVVSVQLETASSSSIELKTTKLTLPEGVSAAPAQLDLQVQTNGDLQSGKNTFSGNILFNVQDRPAFCAMPFSVEFWNSRLILPEPNLEGKAGEIVQAKLEYDTSGQATVESIEVSLTGVPPELIAIDEGATTLTPEADTQGTLRIPIRIDSAATTDEPKVYQGELLFTYPDGRQETSEFSLRVIPPSFVDQWWPLLAGLTALLVGAVAFIGFDPFCFRCKLSGNLVYLNLPQGAIVLSGRRQQVMLSNSSQPIGAPTVLLVRAQNKQQPPVVDIKETPDRVWIDGTPYQQGDTGISLNPDAIIEVDGARLKYETFAYSVTLPVENKFDESESFGSGLGDTIRLGQDDYDSPPVNPYDQSSSTSYNQPPPSKSGPDSDDSFADLDY